MKKLFILLAVVLLASCSKDDSVTNHYTVSDQPIYETYHVRYDSQDNLVKFNNSGEWESSIELGSTDLDNIDELSAANNLVGFRHNGWGVLNIVAADGYELVSVNLFPESYDVTPIYANATNINSDRTTLYYDGGADYAEGSDTYSLTVTMKIN